ncbi:TcpE family conjugal transfer membrane protein [Lipingzhangella sp. LS1_29]|uniref:TcpE family conjugal transfer membrane protein n=1 Tax=Lipingzhangella rawalii TaxID=2055835 RepID=A0ABU2HBE5_9ACTN|nr:TcpE family conjugal transfer membrane protein [Lipingzhangella rawalii]MDS1272312.1 TcpE family conjugal transfer membrane protein [Lipingzhangella rawalii]
MDLPTYTSIWRIEKRLYKLYDFRLPMPLPVATVGVCVGIAVVWILLMRLVNMPWEQPWHVVWIVPPFVLGYVVTRPVVEGKRLTELMLSYSHYLLEARVYCRLAPEREPEQATVTVRVWHRDPNAGPLPVVRESRAVRRHQERAQDRRPPARPRATAPPPLPLPGSRAADQPLPETAEPALVEADPAQVRAVLDDTPDTASAPSSSAAVDPAADPASPQHADATHTREARTILDEARAAETLDPEPLHGPEPEAAGTVGTADVEHETRDDRSANGSANGSTIGAGTRPSSAAPAAGAEVSPASGDIPVAADWFSGPAPGAETEQPAGATARAGTPTPDEEEAHTSGTRNQAASPDPPQRQRRPSLFRRGMWWLGFGLPAQPEDATSATEDGTPDSAADSAHSSRAETTHPPDRTQRHRDGSHRRGSPGEYVRRLRGADRSESRHEYVDEIELEEERRSGEWFAQLRTSTGETPLGLSSQDAFDHASDTAAQPAAGPDDAEPERDRAQERRTLRRRAEEIMSNLAPGDAAEWLGGRGDRTDADPSQERETHRPESDPGTEDPARDRAAALRKLRGRSRNVAVTRQLRDQRGAPAAPDDTEAPAASGRTVPADEPATDHVGEVGQPASDVTAGRAEPQQPTAGERVRERAPAPPGPRARGLATPAQPEPAQPQSGESDPPARSRPRPHAAPWELPETEASAQASDADERDSDELRRPSDTSPPVDGHGPPADADHVRPASSARASGAHGRATHAGAEPSPDESSHDEPDGIHEAVDAPAQPDPAPPADTSADTPGRNGDVDRAADHGTVDHGTDEQRAFRDATRRGAQSAPTAAESGEPGQRPDHPDPASTTDPDPDRSADRSTAAPTPAPGHPVHAEPQRETPRPAPHDAPHDGADTPAAADPERDHGADEHRGFGQVARTAQEQDQDTPQPETTEPEAAESDAAPAPRHSGAAAGPGAAPEPGTDEPADAEDPKPQLELDHGTDQQEAFRQQLHPDRRVRSRATPPTETPSETPTETPTDVSAHETEAPARHDTESAGHNDAWFSEDAPDPAHRTAGQQDGGTAAEHRPSRESGPGQRPERPAASAKPPLELSHDTDEQSAFAKMLRRFTPSRTGGASTMGDQGTQPPDREVSPRQRESETSTDRPTLDRIERAERAAFEQRRSRLTGDPGSPGSQDRASAPGQPDQNTHTDQSAQPPERSSRLERTMRTNQAGQRPGGDAAHGEAKRIRVELDHGTDEQRSLRALHSRNGRSGDVAEDQEDSGAPPVRALPSSRLQLDHGTGEQRSASGVTTRDPDRSARRTPNPDADAAGGTSADWVHGADKPAPQRRQGGGDTGAPGKGRGSTGHGEPNGGDDRDSGPRAAAPNGEQGEPPTGRKRGSPGRGWRRLASVVAGPQESPASELSSADLERVRTPLDGGHRAVVLGCTGGAGQTSTVLMLGHTLASLREERVVAVDMNPGESSLSRRVPTESTETLTSLLANAERVQRQGYTAMRAYTSQTATGLEALASLDDPYVHTLDDRDLTRMATALEQHYPVTLLDPAATGVARALPLTDSLVLVAPASGDAARAVAMTFEWLDGHGYAGLRARSIVVVNGVSKRSLPDVEAAEQVARGSCRAIVRVPWDDHVPGVHTLDFGSLRASTRRAHGALAGVLVTSLAGGEHSRR